MKIIKQKDCVFLVQIGAKYHIVRHDPRQNMTYAIHHTDVIKGFEPRSAQGFNEAAVRHVSKPRTLKTGQAYFNEACRHLSRADSIKKLSFTPREHFELGNSMSADVI